MSNRKIGILTQPLHNNYGGLLQNYALQQALIREGFEPETIDHNKKTYPWVKQFVSDSKEKLFHFLLPNTFPRPRYRLTKKEFDIISHNSQFFINRYINHTAPFTTIQELEELLSRGNYSGFVVGSDQCWRPRYSEGFLKEMFLSFIDGRRDIRRISYAASFGTDLWEFNPEMTNECARLAQQFDCISVREDSGVYLCNTYLRVKATQVLDPTMLLSKEDYLKIVEEQNEPISTGDLFYYILDPTKEKIAFINEIAASTGLSTFTVLPLYQAENRTRWDVKHHIKDCVYPSVTSWLRAFIDAKMTVVDSFHGTVFSIIFNKPFWTISNSERGNARFYSLLKMFGLEDRLVGITQLKKVDYQRPIDWSTVNKIWEQRIEESKQVFEYLK